MLWKKENLTAAAKNWSSVPLLSNPYPIRYTDWAL
jgi:hypothetical protein